MAAIKVLLVEDEPLVRMMIAEALREEGFHVTEASDGDQAAQLIDEVAAFDMLFTDVQMPGRLDGIGVAVHARNRHSTIPVLVVSGQARSIADRLAALDHPMAFLSKPYRISAVLATLQGLAQGLALG